MALKIILSVLFGLLILGIVLVVIADDGDPGRKLAWLLVITFIPVLGIILYLLFGINLRHHWIFDRKHARFRSLFEKEASPRLLQILYGTDTLSEVKEYYRQFSTMLGTMPSCAVTDGNDFELITEGSRKFELLMADLAAAKHSIHMEYFHFGNDDSSKCIKELLMAKAREGVKVRFIHENIANLPISSKYYENMRKAGVEVVKFTNPRQHVLDMATRLNFRDHRKIVIIDGRIGYTGGMNINNHYFKEWRDTHMRITGKAVATLQYLFLDAWLTGGGAIDKPLIEFFPQAQMQEGSSKGIGPDFRQDDNMETADNRVTAENAAPALQDAPEHIEINAVHPVLKNKLMQIVPDEPSRVFPILQFSYEWFLLHSKKYIWLQTPYFVPTEPVMHALKAAALCGVDVRLMLPRRADNIFMRPANKAYYSEALDAGVKIFLKNQFIHAKTFVCDDYVTSIGTANLDYRSFDIDYEVNSYIYDEETAIYYKRIFQSDLDDCREITKEEWDKRPYYKTLIDNIFRLFAPLL